jgi:dCMP deaminase
MRKPWNEYFMDLAFMVATRSTCVRKKVGAVIINPEFKAIIATGYNGSLPLAPHCEDVGCHIVDGHCTTTIHAETNAINQAAKMGVRLQNTAIYCTCKPCWNCFKNLIQSGVESIYFQEDYIDSNQKLYENYLDENPRILLERIPTIKRVPQ